MNMQTVCWRAKMKLSDHNGYEGTLQRKLDPPTVWYYYGCGNVALVFAYRLVSRQDIVYLYLFSQSFIIPRTCRAIHSSLNNLPRRQWVFCRTESAPPGRCCRSALRGQRGELSVGVSRIGKKPTPTSKAGAREQEGLR